MEAISSYYKHDGLKEHKSIVLRSGGSEVWNGSTWAKIKVLAGLCCFWKPSWKMYLFPCLFWLLATAHISRLVAPFLHLHSQQWPVQSFPPGSPLTRTLLPPSSTYEHPCDFTGPTIIIPVPFSNLQVSRLATLILPSHVMYVLIGPRN